MINLLFCGNHKVFDGILSCLISVCRRTETKEPLNVIIFTMDVHHLNPDYTPVTTEQAEFLAQVIGKYNPENKVTMVDVTDIYMREFAGSPNEPTKYSPYCMIRLFADLVPEVPDKVLYLDADLMFAKDIRRLYDMDVEAYEYAAARDHYGKLILFWDRMFMNSGVILFNMKECRKTGLLVKARNLIRARKLIFPDELAIIRSTERQLRISQRFNDQKFLYKDTVIRHFSKRLFYTPYPHTENIKQWNVTRLHRRFGYTQFDDILYEYIYLRKAFDNHLKEF